MRPSKHGTENNKALTGRTYTLHQRLTQALNLGTRFYHDKAKKWQCMDIEIQRHVLQSIAPFLDSVSGDTLHHPLVKASVADIVGALVWILQSNNGPMLIMAADMTGKLVSILPKSVLQLYAPDLVNPLSSLLSSHQTEVAILCAAALNHIISNVSTKTKNEVWEVFKKKESVSQVISNLRFFPGCTKPLGYFQKMALLLSTILWWWPPSRFSVWNDAKLMKGLNDMLKLDVCEKVAVLKLYSALALCGNGAKKLLESEEVLEQMVQCMDNSHPHFVRIEGFKLAQCLAINEKVCLQLMSSCCEPLIKAIISGMSVWSSHSRKITNDEMSLLEEACHLALITRWAGEHHIYLWKQGIDKILIDLLFENFHNQPYKHSMSLDKQISTAMEGLSANYLLDKRNYVWDILGWLAIHCAEDFVPESELYINILITCACVTFVDAIGKGHKIYENGIAGAFRSESATRAVSMMIYSPCNYIASKTRFILSEILEPDGLEHLKNLVRFLIILSSGNTRYMPDKLQIIIYLMGLACYSGLPKYQSWVIKRKGVKILLAFMRWCLSKRFRLERSSFSPHLHNAFHERICCWVSAEDWEGKDVLLFYSLWGLAVLIQNSGRAGNNLDNISDEMRHTEVQLVSKLKDICHDNCTPGLQWYATYILSYFGYYGFPSKHAKIGEALNEMDFADIQLILANGECLSVHGVVLAIQCPSLLPPEGLLPSEVTSDDSSVTGSMEIYRGFQKDIRLSAHVDHQALVMLLQYIYFGYLEAEEELAKKLRTLSKRCNLQSLLQMLYRKRPKWGTALPSLDLSVALHPSGRRFWDVILEAKETGLLGWTCGVCSLSVPHMHVHKVVLSANCNYFRALFKSGMQESHSKTIKVPISWEAMVKLVNYFYSSKLPKPLSGCLWNNMDTEEKFHELQPYVELWWLSDFWLIEDIQEVCSDLIVSCLGSARVLSIKILRIAVKFSLWKLVEVAATYAAPIYRQLCDSGELEALDEMLVDMVREASVRLSQQGGNHSE